MPMEIHPWKPWSTNASAWEIYEEEIAPDIFFVEFRRPKGYKLNPQHRFYVCKGRFDDGEARDIIIGGGKTLETWRAFDPLVSECMRHELREKYGREG